MQACDDYEKLYGRCKLAVLVVQAVQAAMAMLPRLMASRCEMGRVEGWSSGPRELCSGPKT